MVIRLNRYYIDLGLNPLSSTFILFSYYAAKNQKKLLAILSRFLREGKKSVEAGETTQRDELKDRSKVVQMCGSVANHESTDG